MNKQIKRAVIAAAVGGAAAAAAAAAGGIAFTNREMKKEFPRGKYPESKFRYGKTYENSFKDSHPRENVQFKSGENTLQGYIYGMENESPKGLIVFAHGISVGHESYIAQLIDLVERGWRVFAYDATGSCTSEGESTVGLVQSALDLDCALNYAKTDDRLNGLPVFLLGHSWGGYAVCAVQEFDHDIKAAVSLSGYAYPIEMLYFGTENILGKTGAKLSLPFIMNYNKTVFGENASLNAVDSLNKSQLPTLIIHGEEDRLVDFDRVSIYSKRDEITNPRAEFVKLTGKYADHIRIFKSERSNEYTEKYYGAIRELIAEHSDLNESGDKKKDDNFMDQTGLFDTSADFIPDDIRDEFMKNWDMDLLNEVNHELLDMIEAFFINHADKS